MLVPIYAFLRGDTLGVLVLVQDSDTIEHLAEVVADAVSMRVAPPSGRLAVYANDRRLDAKATVSGAGLSALDRVDVAIPRATAGPPPSSDDVLGTAR